jgi:hypothetical protein
MGDDEALVPARGPVAEAELRAAVNEQDGHALALMLLGKYLHEVHADDIGRRHDVSMMAAAEAVDSGKLERIMAAYDAWLALRPRAVMRLVGLFDRPADNAALGALRRAPRSRGSPGRSWTRARGSAPLALELSALAAFVDRCWDRPSDALESGAPADILEVATYDLYALGWLTEALVPAEIALALNQADGKWDPASVDASILAGIELLLGRLGAAESHAACG